MQGVYVGGEMWEVYNLKHKKAWKLIINIKICFNTMKHFIMYAITLPLTLVSKKLTIFSPCYFNWTKIVTVFNFSTMFEETAKIVS